MLGIILFDLSINGINRDDKIGARDGLEPIIVYKQIHSQNTHRVTQKN